jgi:hypothetical protein
MDPVHRYRRALHELAGPDETVRAAARCRAPLAGSVGIAPTLSTPPPPEPWYWRGLGVLSGGDSIVRADPDKLLGGTSVAGTTLSHAARLHRPLAKGDNLFCVVTDRRLILADARSLYPASFRPLADVPVEAVARARRHGWFLQRGRVVLEFTDGSRLALFTGVLGTSRAHAIVDALTVPA